MLMIDEVVHSSRCLLIQLLHAKYQLCLLLLGLAYVLVELTLHLVSEANEGVPQDSFYRALASSRGLATAFEGVINAYLGLVKNRVADDSAY